MRETFRGVRLSGRRSPADVVARARDDLRRAGWRILDGADFYLNARRGPSCLHLLTAPGPREPPPPKPAAGSSREQPTPEARHATAQGLSLSVTDC